MEELVRQLLLGGFLKALAEGRVSLADSGPLIQKLFSVAPEAPPRFTVTKLWVDGKTVENGAFLWRQLGDAFKQRDRWNDVAACAGNGRPYFVLDKLTGMRI